MQVEKKMLMEYYNVSAKTIDDWVRAGMPILFKAGKGSGKQNAYESDAVHNWLVKREVKRELEKYLPAEADDPDTPRGSPLEKEKVRKTKAEADLAEHKVKIAEGEVVPADKVEATWSQIVGDFRQAVLQLPLRLAPVLLMKTTQEDVKTTIESEVFPILEALARDPDYSYKIEEDEEEETQKPG